MLTKLLVNIDPTGQRQQLKELVGLVEEMRLRRREEWRDRVHPQQKRFTQEEIRSDPCPTYHNWLSGRSTRIPSRQTILDIARYLECTIDETNQLLSAAQYMPEYELLSEWQYQHALIRARVLSSMIALPNVVVGRLGSVHYANAAVAAINNHPPLDQWCEDEKNIAHWFFNPDLNGVYRVSPEVWEFNATSAVEMTYLQNLPYVREKSFTNRIEQWKKLPEFASYWTRIDSAAPAKEKVHGENLTYTPLLDTPIREQNIVIPIMPNLEVNLVVGVPIDDAARHVYRQLGCEIDHCRWEAMLREASTLCPG